MVLNQKRKFGSCGDIYTFACIYKRYFINLLIILNNLPVFADGIYKFASFCKWYFTISSVFTSGIYLSASNCQFACICQWYRSMCLYLPVACFLYLQLVLSNRPVYMPVYPNREAPKSTWAQLFKASLA